MRQALNSSQCSAVVDISFLMRAAEPKPSDLRARFGPSMSGVQALWDETDRAKNVSDVFRSSPSSTC